MRPNEKKKEIIHKTVELLSSSDGAAELTTRRIAENAGINPAMVNYYFGSKDSLLKATLSFMNGDRTEQNHGTDGTRKAMFDYLVRMCESSIQYARFGLNGDAAAFSKDILEISLRLIDMKRTFGKNASKEDAAAIFKTVCFLMAASADPGGFAEFSGVDIRIKSQLRLLVSNQLDILLGDSL